MLKVSPPHGDSGGGGEALSDGVEAGVWSRGPSWGGVDMQIVQGISSSCIYTINLFSALV